MVEFSVSSLTMKLYSHPMSSCARRVRLALNLKGFQFLSLSITEIVSSMSNRFCMSCRTGI
ncbi:putative glutathione S-transferase, Thioredoxin-like superfamily [Helianthus annuus]|nr:putative glutathione S-transferase, Thioredoxin-like superfamily [Helianthus annuus]